MVNADGMQPRVGDTVKYSLRLIETQDFETQDFDDGRSHGFGILVSRNIDRGEKLSLFQCAIHQSLQHLKTVLQWSGILKMTEAKSWNLFLQVISSQAHLWASTIPAWLIGPVDATQEKYDCCVLGLLYQKQLSVESVLPICCSSKGNLDLRCLIPLMLISMPWVEALLWKAGDVESHAQDQLSSCGIESLRQEDGDLHNIRVLQAVDFNLRLTWRGPRLAIVIEGSVLAVLKSGPSLMVQTSHLWTGPDSRSFR